MLLKGGKFFIKTYGCAMNYADADKVRTILSSSGASEVSSELDADYVILVSCSVRKKPEDKISGLGIKYLKKKFRGKTVVLTGCMAVRHDRKCDGSLNEAYSQNLSKKLPWIDHVIDIRKIADLPKLLSDANSDKSIAPVSYLEIPQPCSDGVQALIPISTGCDNFCSYCIVPYARGSLINYSFKKVYEEAVRFISGNSDYEDFSFDENKEGLGDRSR
ncbi:hypothetical protein GF357_04940, partial [Candidatus Dojkabacteria bacterium]|nr:hypothetical protein [Candidatus Dojkabacteria bacterium]